jgi:hypothetical protein
VILLNAGLLLPGIRPRAAAAAGTPASDVFNRRVYVINFDPILSNGQKLTDHQGWNAYSVLIAETTSFFQQASRNRLNYSIVGTTEVNNGWPKKIDGFRYSESHYLATLKDRNLHHEPDTADYLDILNTYDICGKLNRGEIDELWLFGGPWFGFYESRLAGPDAYEYNSPPLTGSSCQKLLPIMGFNYERGTEEMVHDFGHRTEATMTKVYGGWAQNRTSHNWDRFGLTASQSPSYNYAGCGSIHYPLNAAASGDYANLNFADSICIDFPNYPNLGDPQAVKWPTNCRTWGCTELGYYRYWFSSLPHFTGMGPDGKSNDWWQYVAAPATASAPYTNVSERLPSNGAATFSFAYAGGASSYKVDISTRPDMSTDVYVNFATGSASPLTVASPAAMWDKYVCGRTLYWRVTSNTGVRSAIRGAPVMCPDVFYYQLARASSTGPATFNFAYNGNATSYSVNASTVADMSTDVYVNFASGSASPLTVANPAAKWDKYTCDRTLYWQVVASTGYRSPIWVMHVACPNTFYYLSDKFLSAGPASFTFVHNGSASDYTIDVSTVADMSSDVYLNFARGSTIPLVVENPAARWDKYTCGRTLYWRITSNTGYHSQIRPTQVMCPNTYKSMSAKLPGAGPAVFDFVFDGNPASFTIHASTVPDMSTDVYLNFAGGWGTPIYSLNPLARWDKYSCGRTLYWRAVSSTGYHSPIQTARVTCP